MIVLWILIQKNIFGRLLGYFLSIESFRSWSSCIVVASNSEIAFRVLENFRLIICFCFVVIASFVCFFDLLYPIFCGVITRSYLSF